MFINLIEVSLQVMCGPGTRTCEWYQCIPSQGDLHYILVIYRTGKWPVSPNFIFLPKLIEWENFEFIFKRLNNLNSTYDKSQESLVVI